MDKVYIVSRWDWREDCFEPIAAYYRREMAVDWIYRQDSPNDYSFKEVPIA